MLTIFIKRIFFAFLIVFMTMATLIFSVGSVLAESIEDQEARLRAELRKLEEEQAKVAKDLTKQRGESNVIQSEVVKLSSQIQAAQQNINSKANAIKQLGGDIALKDQTVQQLNEKLERSKDALGQLIRKTDELDQVSLTEIIIANENLSDFFVNVDTYNSIQNSLGSLFDEIRELRGLTEEEKNKLQEKRQREQDIKAEIEREKQTVAVKKAEKDNLLSVSKSVEKTYEQILAEKQARANQIRSALFQLRDSAGISFGDALKYAEAASKRTGVRAAFILAILKQESDLGKNVGTCNRSFDPPNKKWQEIMPGPNDNSWRDDQTIFLRIAKQLGLDPDNTPLSCPIAGGWGGAMGPSQFIPATWQAYESKISAALGVQTPNPWNPEHAFTATAIYVRDLGAAAGGYTAERTAALQYYAGSNWAKPQNAFYGNSVINHATTFQQQIDFLNDL